jgi:hypothetical protein
MQKQLIHGTQGTPWLGVMLTQGREAGAGLDPGTIKGQGGLRSSLHCTSGTRRLFL